MPRRRAVRLLRLAQLALFVPLEWCDRRMSATGGKGTIPFELAGTAERPDRLPALARR